MNSTINHHACGQSNLPAGRNSERPSNNAPRAERTSMVPSTTTPFTHSCVVNRRGESLSSLCRGVHKAALDPKPSLTWSRKPSVKINCGDSRTTALYAHAIALVDRVFGWAIAAQQRL